MTYYGHENGVLTGLQKLKPDEPIDNREMQQLVRYFAGEIRSLD